MHSSLIHPNSTYCQVLFMTINPFHFTRHCVTLFLRGITDYTKQMLGETFVYTASFWGKKNIG